MACRLDPDRDNADHNTTLTEFLGHISLRWHGVKLDRPDWNPHSHSLAATVKAVRLGALLHWMLNAYWEQLDFELPPVPREFQGPWCRWVDTGREPPEDICEWRSGWPVTSPHYTVHPRSLAILVLCEQRPNTETGNRAKTGAICAETVSDRNAKVPRQGNPDFQ